MVGDYWEKNEATLCQACYDKYLLTSASAYKNIKWVACFNYVVHMLLLNSTWHKVRDCSSIHKHEGTGAQIQV